jgi:tripartite-type tricarboxylate transporter receptor subunit TctC
MQSVKAGMLKGYAATTRERLAVMPELPVAAAAGLSALEITVWFACMRQSARRRRIYAE